MASVRFVMFADGGDNGGSGNRKCATLYADLFVIYSHYSISDGIMILDWPVDGCPICPFLRSDVVTMIIIIIIIIIKNVLI